jgi:hypothetical protein
MLEKLKKHSVKIFVFTINILIAAVAVLIIREKDQARLLENAQKENPANENVNSDPLPSFENSVSAESVDSNSTPADESGQSLPVDSGTVAPSPPIPAIPATPVPTPIPSPAITVPSNPAPVSAPAPAPVAKPSNAKTKTS